MSEEVAAILLEGGAVTLSVGKPYVYASGIKSPIYCDNRLLISHPALRQKIVAQFLEALKGLSFDAVAGTATAGIPWAAWIAEKLGVPMVYVRAHAKDHGKENLIEGKLAAGQKVVVIEDLVSTGTSSLAAVDAVRAAGGKVKECIAIFTYGMKKAEEKFSKAGCRLHTLTDFATLLAVAEREGTLTAAERERAFAWSKNPEGWA